MDRKLENFKLIYIGGYGRSGSTILDILLQNTGAGSFGALSNLPSWVQSDLKCSCGERVSQCVFWMDAIEELRSHNLNLDLFNAFDCFTISTSNVNRINQFYSSIFQKVDSGAHFIVDSSKTTYDTFLRPLRLSQQFDVHFLHVKRRSLDIAKSAMKGSGSPERTRKIRNKYFQFCKAFVLSKITNFVTTLYYRFLFKEQYLAIDFCELQRAPDEQLEAISAMTGLVTGNVLAKLSSNSTLNVGHMLGGNRLRFSKTIRFGAGNDEK
jgi:hypothetical protein